MGFLLSYNLLPMTYHLSRRYTLFVDCILCALCVVVYLGPTTLRGGCS